MIKQKKSSPEIIPATCPDYSERAAAVIRAGGIIAYPTETYYGLGIDPFNAETVERLFHLKRRPLAKPILVIIDNLSQLYRLSSTFPEPYRELVRNHWPGPLTLIFPAREHISTLLTGGTGTVGIRMTSGEIAAAICKSAGFPISATSANISGQPPASSVEKVVNYFGDQVDLIVDGGIAAASQCSTIVAIDHEKRVKVVREGMVRINASND